MLLGITAGILYVYASLTLHIGFSFGCGLGFTCSF